MNELICGLSFIRAAHKLIARKKHINLDALIPPFPQQND